MDMSGSVQINPVSDFINPSQECIIPLMDKSVKPIGIQIKARPQKNSTKNLTESPTPVPTKDSVKISLNDCLACSGCITTAESILIQEQSHNVFRNIAKLKLDGTFHKKIVVSLSPQSISSIAVKHGLDLKTATLNLAAYLKNKLGVDYILDTNFARNLSQLAMGKELVERLNLSEDRKLPLFSSVCPGWICYVEKSHGQLLIPHLSKVRSPQAICGAIAKKYLPHKLNLLGDNTIYHITIMPCFDKKLEASRPEFQGPSENQREVDCVLSTRELELLLNEDNINLRDFSPSNPSDLDPMFLFPNVDSKGGPLNHPGSGSGGYAQYIFAYVAKELHARKVENEDIKFKQVRNKDWQELCLEIEGKVVFSVAIINGFRHIQNLVQKMKRGLIKYDFVEVLACPSGCLNGGGQLAPENNAKQTELLNQVQNLYNSSTNIENIEDWPNLKTFMNEWLGDLNSQNATQNLYTEYKALETTNSSLLKW